MPSGKPNVPEEGFRRQVYGFNTDDVLAYVNALANEAQQQQQQYEEQIAQLKAQLDKLKKEQQNARICVEKLQSDLLAQTTRAEKAENGLAAVRKELSDSQDELKLSESHAVNYRDRYQQSQKTLLEWQNKCRELEQQLQDARAAAAAAAIGGTAEQTDPAPAEEPSYFSAPPQDAVPGYAAELPLPDAPASAPVEEPLAEQPAPAAEMPEEPQPEAPAPAPKPVSPAPAPQTLASKKEPAPQPAPKTAPAFRPAPRPEPEPSQWELDLSASSEARKILADARIYAETTERRMRQEAEARKARMADNARELAAGVQLLRDRLSRVDEKLSAASIDLENATAAIYDALDSTDADLQALGVKLDRYAAGTPELDEPAAPSQPANAPVVPQPVPPAEPSPVKPAASQRVRPVAKAKPQPKPAPPARRLRNSRSRGVAQTLQDAISRLGGDDSLR